LTTVSEQEAEHLAYGLDVLNKERQRIVDEITKQAFDLIEEKYGIDGLPRVLVVAQEGWNVGVIGIVASKILDRYYRPAIVLGIDKDTGMAKGSARSIEGFDIYQALTHCSDLMEHFGGHQAAAGMTIHKDRLAELSIRLNRLAEEWLTEQDFIPVLQADAECSLDEVALDSIRQLELLAPFGMGNPGPKFIFTGLETRELRTMGKDRQHIRLSLSQAAKEMSAAVDAVGFGKSSVIDWISPSSRIDILGELAVNEWNGIRKPQIMIHDMRVLHVQVFDWRGSSSITEQLRELCRRVQGGLPPAVVHFGPLQPETLDYDIEEIAVWKVDSSGSAVPHNRMAKRFALTEASDIVLCSLPFQLSEVEAVIRTARNAERFYAAFSCAGEPESAVLPSRDMFKLVYTSLLREGRTPEGFSGMVRRLHQRSGLSEKLIRFMMEVFEELGFVEQIGDAYIPVPSPAKKDLSASRKFQMRSARADVEQALIYSSSRELSEWICARRPSFLPQTQNHHLEDII
jgi:single-stranded-DNA-specific exonuclease